MSELHGTTSLYVPSDMKRVFAADKDPAFGVPMPSRSSWELMCWRSRPPLLIMQPAEKSEELTFAPLPEMEIDETERGVKHSCVVRRVFVSEEVSFTPVTDFVNETDRPDGQEGKVPQKSASGDSVPLLTADALKRRLEANQALAPVQLHQPALVRVASLTTSWNATPNRWSSSLRRSEWRWSWRIQTLLRR